MQSVGELNLRQGTEKDDGVLRPHHLMKLNKTIV